VSVINESQPGDELICIEGFSTSPKGERSSWDTSRAFRIGERVRYVSYYRDKNLKDNPVCWMVVFEAVDGKQYDATQTYFVTEECWQGLKKFFARRLLQEPKPAKTSRS
jgi:hypothetical protein